MGTESRISVRISAELKKRLESAKQMTGMDEPTIIKGCVEAFCLYVEEQKLPPHFPFAEFRQKLCAEAKARLERAKKTTGLDESVIYKGCLDAFCRYVEDHGESSSFPLELRKPKASEQLIALAAEEHTPYRVKKKGR